MNNDMFGKCGMTQFVGVGVCDTIGLYIANIDDDLRKQMNIPEKSGSSTFSLRTFMILPS